MRAGHLLLRLHDFHRIGDACPEAVTGLGERLFGQVNIALGHGDQFRRGFQVEQGGAHIGVNLAAQIAQALAALLELRVGL